MTLSKHFKLLALSLTATLTVSATGAAGAATFALRGDGVGADPDGDGNPAVKTRGFMRIGDAAEAAFDPPWRVVTFDLPPGKIGERLTTQYAPHFGVSFSTGLTRQLCNGQRDGYFDTQCTYLRAPSGRIAAAYRDDWGAPLEIRFEAPICAAAMAIYPTGGKEGERFRIRLTPFAENGDALPKQDLFFTWTENTFRWRLMAGVETLDKLATRLRVTVDSLDNPTVAVRFLLDDVAYLAGAPCAKFRAVANASGSGAKQSADATPSGTPPAATPSGAAPQGS